MSVPRERVVNPKITDFQNWWRGLSHASDFYFHHAVLELIDNAFSYSITPPGEYRSTHPTIEVILIDQGQDEHQLYVSDNGVGISTRTFEEVIMNPGSLPEHQGLLNEHGFGLKNALSYIQQGELKPFTITSKHGDEIWKLIGPYNQEMRLIEESEEEWMAPIISRRLREHRPTGTTVSTTVKHSVLRTLATESSRRSFPTTFSPLCDRLREHVMVAYRKLLASNPNLHIYVISRSQGSDEYIYTDDASFFTREDGSIRIWQHEYEPATRSQKTIQIRVNGIEYSVPIIIGRAPHDSKEPGQTYHLFSHYYQLTNARVGVDIFVRDRLVKAMEFEEIWGYRPTYSHNWLIGEIELDKRFPTRNNKTHVDIASELWLKLVDKIRDSDQGIEPPETPHKAEHEDVLKLVRKRIVNGRDDITGDVKIEKTTVFGNARVDMWFKTRNSLVYVYEVKVETSSPLDLYQLIMYCDGLVKGGFIGARQKIILYLIAPDHSQGSKGCCDHLRTRYYSGRKKYDIRLGKFTLVTEAEGAIRDISIEHRWYPEEL